MNISKQYQWSTDSTVFLAKNLLGKKLCKIETDGTMTSGVIIETEAYCGEYDKACHAHKGKTPRTETMYGPSGHWYVYMIYGMYFCLNLVTQKEGQPEAILIRGLQPLEGIERMKRRRKTQNISNLCSGPGKLCQAFGITKTLNAKKAIPKSKLFITPYKTIPKRNIISTPRIGIDYAEEYKNKLWRYVIDASKVT